METKLGAQTNTFCHCVCLCVFAPFSKWTHDNYLQQYQLIKLITFKKQKKICGHWNPIWSHLTNPELTMRLCCIFLHSINSTHRLYAYDNGLWSRAIAFQANKYWIAHISCTTYTNYLQNIHRIWLNYKLHEKKTTTKAKWIIRIEKIIIKRWMLTFSSNRCSLFCLHTHQEAKVFLCSNARILYKHANQIKPFLHHLFRLSSSFKITNTTALQLYTAQHTNMEEQYSNAPDVRASQNDWNENQSKMVNGKRVILNVNRFRDWHWMISNRAWMNNKLIIRLG